MRRAPIGGQIAVETPYNHLPNSEVHDAKCPLAQGCFQRAIGTQPESHLSPHREASGLQFFKILQRESGAYKVGGDRFIPGSVTERPGDNARAAAIFFPWGEESQLGVRDAHLIRRYVQLSTKTVEGDSVQLAIRQIEKAGDGRLRPRASPMKLAGQGATHRQGHPKQLFETLGWDFFDIRLSRPTVARQEIPFRQGERSFDVRFHVAASRVSALERKFRRRIRHIAFNEIHKVAVVPRPLSPQVSLKRRCARGSQDFAVPSRAPRNLFLCLRRIWPCPTHTVDKILVVFQSPGIEAHIDHRVARRKNSVDGAA